MDEAGLLLFQDGRIRVLGWDCSCRHNPACVKMRLFTNSMALGSRLDIDVVEDPDCGPFCLWCIGLLVDQHGLLDGKSVRAVEQFVSELLRVIPQRERETRKTTGSVVQLDSDIVGCIQRFLRVTEQWDSKEEESARG